MKTLLNTLLASSLILISINTHAEVKTSAQAVTLCKAQAEKAHPDYKRSSVKKIKQIRTKFKINLRVLTEAGTENIVCEVTKGGEITYAKK